MKKNADLPPLKNAVLLVHEMRAREKFEETAEALFQLVKSAADKKPGAPRVLNFTVQGHRNSEGGFDHDSWELISNFIPGVLGPYLTEIRNPFHHVRLKAEQREDVPDEFFVMSDDPAEKEAHIQRLAAEGIDVEVFSADEFAEKNKEFDV